MLNKQNLANAIYELTSVMPTKMEPHFPQRKEVKPEIRKAILRLESFLRYFSKLVTAPEPVFLLNAVQKLQEQYNLVNSTAKTGLSPASETSDLSELSDKSNIPATAEPGAQLPATRAPWQLIWCFRYGRFRLTTITWNCAMLCGLSKNT